MRFWASLLAASLLAFAPAQAGQKKRSPDEKDKIEALIRKMENLEGATFIRNGIEYDARSAGAFLRGKWRSKKAAVKTARDFIERIASFSSISGRPYLIRLKGGQEIKSGDFLRAELMKLVIPTK